MTSRHCGWPRLAVPYDVHWRILRYAGRALHLQGEIAVPRYLLSMPLAFLLLSAPLAAGEKVRQKLYITNSAGNDITIADTLTNKVIGRIEVGAKPHGIAVPA